MTEYLAIPAWKNPPRSLDDWTTRLAAIGHPVSLAPEPPEGVWLEIPTLSARGLALVEDGAVVAIDFEFEETETAPPLVESVAMALGWELHLDEGGDD